MIKKIYITLFAGLPGLLLAQNNLVYKLDFPPQYSKYYADLYDISTNYVEVQKVDHQYALKITSHSLDESDLNHRIICDDFNLETYGLKPELSASLGSKIFYPSNYKVTSAVPLPPRASSGKIVENSTTLPNKSLRLYKESNLIKSVDRIPILLLVYNFKKDCWSYEKQEANLVFDELRSNENELFYVARFLLPEKLAKNVSISSKRQRRNRRETSLPIIFKPIQKRP